VLDVTSGTPLKLSTALLLFLILHSINTQELATTGIQYTECYKFTDIIKAKRKGRNNLELEMSSSHMPYEKIAVTAVPVHVIYGEWETAPQILNICTKWRWEENFMLRPLHLSGKKSNTHLISLVGPIGGVDNFEKRKIFCSSQDQPQTVPYVAQLLYCSKSSKTDANRVTHFPVGWWLLVNTKHSRNAPHICRLSRKWVTMGY